MLIEAYFKATGYQLDTVGNGELAVEQFKRKRYDLVLMDLHMPVMDGLHGCAANTSVGKRPTAAGIRR